MRNGRIVHFFGAARMSTRYEFCSELVIFNFIQSKKYLSILLCFLHKG